MPLACVIDNSYFCVHGGISPDLETLDQIDKIDRFTEIPMTGLMCDLVWSDPFNENRDALREEFKENKERECSYYFGREPAKKFLEKNGLITIVRGH